MVDLQQHQDVLQQQLLPGFPVLLPVGGFSEFWSGFRDLGLQSAGGWGCLPDPGHFTWENLQVHRQFWDPWARLTL